MYVPQDADPHFVQQIFGVPYLQVDEVRGFACCCISLSFHLRCWFYVRLRMVLFFSRFAAFVERARQRNVAESEYVRQAYPASQVLLVASNCCQVRVLCSLPAPNRHLASLFSHSHTPNVRCYSGRTVFFVKWSFVVCSKTGPIHPSATLNSWSTFIKKWSVDKWRAFIYWLLVVLLLSIVS